VRATGSPCSLWRAGGIVAAEASTSFQAVQAKSVPSAPHAREPGDNGGVPRRALAALSMVAGLAGGAGATATVRSYPAPPPILRPGQYPYSSLARKVRLNYLLYAPSGYGTDPKRRWPLIVFLHGSGERGTDPLRIEAQPLPKTLTTTTSFPAVVLSPQLPPTYSWWTSLLEPVDALVQQTERRYRIDTRRVYLTGLSLGGFGTWRYGLQHPTRFAALVPIAGGYVPGSSAIPRNICALRGTPIWAFHGLADTIVSPSQSETLVKALRTCGSSVVRLTLYGGVNHFGSWPRAYADPALWKWLFAQRQR
jgi:predicted peptidase